MFRKDQQIRCEQKSSTKVNVKVHKCDKQKPRRKKRETFTGILLNKFKTSFEMVQYNKWKYIIPGFAVYSLAGLVYTIYVCEWKTVLQYVPYYGGKYEDR